MQRFNLIRIAITMIKIYREPSSTPVTIIQHPNRKLWILIVLAIGICLRAWAVWQTVLINPDGALYIYQAKMLLSASWGKLTGCGLSYVSIYPLLITGTHFLVSDWILSAQLVSAVFSTATLIPIYYLCRQFFDARLAALATCIAAVNPVMCSRSADVVRDPVFWFFLVVGFLYTVRGDQGRAAFYNLILASCAFILAAWARIEAIFPLFATAVFLCFKGRNHFLRRLLTFLLPVLTLGILVLVVMSTSGVPMDRMLRIDDIMARAAAVPDAYQAIRSATGDLAGSQSDDRTRLFLLEAKTNIWIIALGTVVNRFLESFFYPFVPFFLIGYFCFNDQRLRNWRWRYLLGSALVGWIVLYFHLINTWILEYRFMMLVFLPSTPMAAAGISWTLRQVESRMQIPAGKALVWIALLILAAGLVKNLQPRDPDKIVFRQIAQTIADTQTNAKPALISSSGHTHRLLSLYANLEYADPPCPESDVTESWGRYAGRPDKLVLNLQNQGIDFFVYEEKNWPVNESLPQLLFKNPQVQMLGQWFHPDTGKIWLYWIDSKR
jgi:hypothetical protein